MLSYNHQEEIETPHITHNINRRMPAERRHTMKHLSKDEKSGIVIETCSTRAAEIVDRYLSSPYRTLFDCFKKPGPEKVKAWMNIIRDMRDKGGYGLKVTGRRMCFSYSAAFFYDDGDETYMRYYTSSGMHEYRVSYHMEKIAA